MNGLLFPKPELRAKKVKKYLPKVKKTTVAKAKAKAWAVFTIYYRMSNADSNGMLKCFTCDKLDHWKKMQSGHWVTGHNNATYINPDFVRPQCPVCNIWKGGMQGEFRDRIRKELGDYTVNELLVEARQTKEILLVDYIELEAKYKQKVKELNGFV